MTLSATTPLFRSGLRGKLAMLALSTLGLACSSDAKLPTLGAIGATSNCAFQQVGVSPSAVTVAVGDTASVTASANTCGQTNVGQKFSWIVTDTSIASITPRDSVTALVRARTVGTSAVIARFQSDTLLTGAASVTVTR